MVDEKVLTPEEEKVIAKISGEQIEKAVEILDSAEVKSTMVADEDGIHHIDKASETLGKPEDQLGADMVRLAEIDKEIKVFITKGKDIQEDIDDFLVAKGFDLLLDQYEEKKKTLRTDYALLNEDLKKRALANYKKTGEKKPADGLEIKMYKNREFSVDIKKAIQWCIDKDLKVFLAIDKEKYPEQLALGTFPDMPGKVDDSKIPKATISIKPYQKKES